MKAPFTPRRSSLPLIIFFCLLLFVSYNLTAQTVILNGNAGGKRFDGIGTVSGGGATSVLLKEYPEPQRSQVLDLLFKPKFGASMSALLVEVPGDGNSTQGTEPSHMRSKNEENYFRGYEWWIMSEAKKRNPAITLDANAWSCPGWIGNGTFWSQDMCDYYVTWIKGLKAVHGLDLEAIGCRNEKGVSKDFVKMFRTTLNNAGLNGVKIHAFDNWTADKFAWCKDMLTDSVLRASVDIMSAHTMAEIPTPPDVIKLSETLGKPIWNSEEHNARVGFDCEISLVEQFNKNFIDNGVTKIVNWFLVGSTYTNEPYNENAATMIAREPWSGHYYTREVLWGYAHYGQFSAAGWQYLNGACGKLNHGGTYVTLKSPDKEYSIILETKGATKEQKVTFKLAGGLSDGKLCVWRSNAKAQFVRMDDLVPSNGVFELVVDTQSIYSLSTTTGQQKGSFCMVPASAPFPFPFNETFDEYSNPKAFGYLPGYTADIVGVFELADRTDKKGKCVRQVIGDRPQSWAPEWMPYSVIGNPDWRDYEVKADVYIENEGRAGVMGRVSGTGGGYGTKPSGYYMTLSSSGECALYVSDMKERNRAGILLASAVAPNVKANEWHTVALAFSDSTIVGSVDGKPLLKAQDSKILKGSAGLVTGSISDKKYTTAQFDNLRIGAVAGQEAKPRTLSARVNALYPDTEKRKR